MMRKKLFFACLLLSVAALRVTAQKKIVLENIRYRTAINYLYQPEMQQLFAANLNSLLLKHLQISLADTTRVPLLLVKENKDLVRNYDFRNTDIAVLHLVIDVFEIPANTYFSSQRTPAAAAARNAAKTVFSLNLALINANNQVAYNEPLYIVVNNSGGPGMGNESTIVKILPKTFVEIMKAGINIILDPKNDLQQVTMTVPPVFAMDNYVAPVLMNQPRIYVDTTKQFIKFSHKGRQQLLRHGQSTEEEIIWKGRNAKKYPAIVTDAIRESAYIGSSVFLFMRQEERDVVNNKNYQLQVMLQITPLAETRGQSVASSFINDKLGYRAADAGNALFAVTMGTYFLDGQVHMLLDEQDTVAIFNIQKDITENKNLVFPSRIYNGVDSNTAMITELASQYWAYRNTGGGRPTNQAKTTQASSQEPPVWPMEYPFVLTGKFKGRNLTIKCGGFNRELKEFYLDNELVCIGQGKLVPEKFVVFDASLPTELLNPLLLLGFNNFFL